MLLVSIVDPIRALFHFFLPGLLQNPVEIHTKIGVTIVVVSETLGKYLEIS